MNAEPHLGDRVRLSFRWQRSNGVYGGTFAQAVGTVTGLIALGDSEIARVRWDLAGLPSEVNADDLDVVLQSSAISGKPEIQNRP